MIVAIICLIVILIIFADYYASKWLVLNECLEGILGFRWCFNGTSTTPHPTLRTTPSTPMLIVHPVPVTLVATTTSTSTTETPPASTTESILITILASTMAASTAVSTAYATILPSPSTSTPIIAEVPATMTIMQVPSTTEGPIIVPLLTFPPFQSTSTSNPVVLTSEEVITSTLAPNPIAEASQEVVTLPFVEEQSITAPLMSLPPVMFERIVTESSLTFTNKPKMLKRQHDVLDPAVEVEPVLNANGQPMFGLHEVPLYKNVDESEPLASLLNDIL